jgi:nitrite reductase/ring-hydroxylating ferredoxin subunit
MPRDDRDATAVTGLGTTANRVAAERRTMAGATLTTVERVAEDGSYLFTATNSFDMEEEVIVVPCEDGTADGDDTDGDGSPADQPVRAWINRCTHEAQRFDTGRGVPMRDGEIICPKHGSMFDACSGDCDNGEAAGTTLPDVNVTVEGGEVLLADDEYTFEHEGSIDEGGDGPSSTSHIGF